jgi:hypothetical protein
MNSLWDNIAFRIFIISGIILVWVFSIQIFSLLSGLMSNHVIEDYFRLLNIFPIVLVLVPSLYTPNTTKSQYLTQAIYFLLFFVFNFSLFFIFMNYEITSSYTTYVFSSIPMLMLDFSPTLLISLYLLYRYFTFV